MAFEDDWNEITSDPKWNTLPASQRKDLARTFAQRIARQEVPGNHKRMKDFLAQNVVGQPTRPDTKSAFAEGAREGFDQSAAGIFTNAATGRKQHEGPGAWQAFKNATSDMAPRMLGGTGANPLIGEGAMRGALGAAGSMAGQLPDIAAGWGLGSAAAKGLAGLGVKALPAQIAGSVGVGAATGAGITKATGGTNSDAAKNAAVMGLMGLAPLAGRIPSGALNPTLIAKRVKPPVIPAISNAPKINLLKPAPRQQTRAIATVGPQPVRGPRKPLMPEFVGNHEIDAQLFNNAQALNRSHLLDLQRTPDGTIMLPGKQHPMVDALDMTETAPWRADAWADDIVNNSLFDTAGDWGGQGPRPALPEPTSIQQGPIPGYDARGLAALEGQVGQRPGSNRPTIEALGPEVAPLPGPFPQIPQRTGLPSQFDMGPVPGYKDPFTSQFGTRPTQATRGAGEPSGWDAVRKLVDDEGGTFDPDKMMRGVLEAWQTPLRAFLGKPKITKTQNASDLRVKVNKSVEGAERKPFMGGRFFLARGVSERWPRGSYLVYDGETPIASYDGRNLVVEPAYRRQGIATNLVATYRTENPSVSIADARTKNAQKTQISAHRKIVQDAVKQGRPVPTEVLRDYPDLMAHVRRIIDDEGGAFDLNATLLGAARAVDTAKGATEAALSRVTDATKPARQAAGRAVRTSVDFAGTQATRALGATKDGAAAIGDLTTYPARKATEAWQATGAPEAIEGWRMAAKHRPADTPFKSLNEAIDGTRRAFISRWNAPPELLQAAEAARLVGQRATEPTMRLAIDLNKRLTGAEQFDLHQQVTETGYKGVISADARAVKAESDRLSGEQLGVGALTPKAHAKYKGFYLPRAYTKYFKPGQWVNELVSPQGLGGYYHRGTTETMSKATLAKRISLGEDWKVEHTFKNGRVEAWKDYTPAERMKWGEIRHVGRALQKFAARASRDIEKGDLFRQLASGIGDAKGAFAEPVAGYLSPGMKVSELPPTMKINGQDYVLFDARTAKTSGVKKWGKLASHYVREDVAHYLRWDASPNRTIQAINQVVGNSAWKKLVTVGNFPGYFLNNAMQNIPTLELAGGSMFDLPGAAYRLAIGDPIIQSLTDAGVVKQGVLAQELGRQLRDLNANLTSTHMPPGFQFAKAIAKAQDALRAYETTGYAVAGATDDMYRIALVYGLTHRQGMGFDEAAGIAKTAFYDASQVTAPAAQVASTIIPFVRVFWWTVDRLPQLAIQNPGQAAQLAATMAAMPWVLNKMMGKSDEQMAAENEALYPHMKGLGNSVPTGHDSNGNPTYLDTSNWNPGGQFSVNPHTALPSLLRGLSPGGPIASTAQMYANRDMFTGKNIIDYDAQGNVVDDRTDDFMRRNLQPGTVRNIIGVANAAMGKTTAHGNRVTVADALVRAAGFKSNPIDVGETAGREAGVLRASVAEYTRQIGRRRRLAARAYAAGDDTSAQTLQDEIADLVEKRLQVIQAGQERLGTLTAPASAGASQ